MEQGKKPMEYVTCHMYSKRYMLQRFDFFCAISICIKDLSMCWIYALGLNQIWSMITSIISFMLWKWTVRSAHNIGSQNNVHFQSEMACSDSILPFLSLVSILIIFPMLILPMRTSMFNVASLHAFVTFPGSSPIVTIGMRGRSFPPNFTDEAIRPNEAATLSLEDKEGQSIFSVQALSEV